jgi:hypothetical protein
MYMLLWFHFLANPKIIERKLNNYPLWLCGPNPPIFA